MARENIPKAVREAVMDEYSHKCAVCGADRPHLHHIDEDNSNSVQENLIPLCPNHHLTDQHNPTRKIEIPKLQLFRKYRDPAILKPQFHPIYQRMLFLLDIPEQYEKDLAIETKAKELVEFIRMFEMGEFYSSKIKNLTKAEMFIPISFGPGESSIDMARENQKLHAAHRNKLLKNKDEIFELIIELLRYQSWANQ